MDRNDIGRQGKVPALVRYYAEKYQKTLRDLKQPLIIYVPVTRRRKSWTSSTRLQEPRWTTGSGQFLAQNGGTLLQQGLPLGCSTPGQRPRSCRVQERWLVSLELRLSGRRTAAPGQFHPGAAATELPGPVVAGLGL